MILMKIIMFKYESRSIDKIFNKYIVKSIGKFDKLK